MEVIGLIPAGGVASRLGKIPCSKEVFPIFSASGELSVTSAHLVRSYASSGICDILFIIRKGKWDIPGYFGCGEEFGAHIGYLIMNLPFGTPFTLNEAFPFVKDKIVALGFPDILFEPQNAFVLLKERMLSGNADVMLGLVSSDQYLRSDMIEFDEHGRIREIVIKQDRPDLKLSWFIALWKPSFTFFMKGYLENLIHAHPEGKITCQDNSTREVYVGDVIQAAINKGLQVDYHIFEKGKYTDVGTLEELRSTSHLPVQ
jgi:glucose-1-phosphate thymidylyltransferase